MTEKNPKMWTYCFTISDEAEDFVKTVYENTTFETKEFKEKVITYLKKRKAEGVDVINMYTLSVETEVPMLYLDKICDELLKEGVLQEQKEEQ